MIDNEQVKKSSYIACMIMANSCRVSAFMDLNTIQYRLQLYIQGYQMIENQK